MSKKSKEFHGALMAARRKLGYRWNEGKAKEILTIACKELGKDRPKRKQDKTVIFLEFVGIKAPQVRRRNRASTNDFLKTYEWRKLRMVALKKHGARCQCCGASPKDGARLNVDHIKPRKTHPELALSIDNLQVLCDACNHGKGNWDDTDWR